MGTETKQNELTKDDLALLRAVFNVMNKAKFDVTGPEVVQIGNVIMAFAKLINDKEQDA